MLEWKIEHTFGIFNDFCYPFVTKLSTVICYLQEDKNMLSNVNGKTYSQSHFIVL